MRLAALVAACLVGLAVLLAGAGAGDDIGVARRAAAAEDAPKVWPPAGPTWETDAETAFEKARKEEKAVFVYVATES